MSIQVHTLRHVTDAHAHEPPTLAHVTRTCPRKSRFAIFGLLVLIALAGWGARASLFTKPAPNVRTAPAIIGNIEDTVLASGTLKPVKLVAVGAQVSGRITALKVVVGQEVKRGDLIAEIESVPQQNNLRTALANLESIRAQRTEKEATLAYAQGALARQEVTFAQKASSRADYDSAFATVKTTQAQIAALDAQIVQAEVAAETARVNLAYTRITAPIDGTVLAVTTQEGQTVNAVQSAPTIVILGQIDTMTIRAEISEADVVRVTPGQPVYFTILGDRDHRYEAVLQSIEPAPESIRNDSSFSASTTNSASSTSSTTSTSSAIYYNGIFIVPNPGRRLRTYMTAEVHIVLAAARNVLTIPAAALSRPQSDGSHFVQMMDATGSLVWREVRIGLQNKVAAEVLSGLNEGDRVVTGQISATPPPARLPGPPPMGF